MISKELLNQLKGEVEEQGEVINEFVGRILEEYCKELDELVGEVEEMMELVERSEIEQITDEDLERMIIKIPQLMYRANDKVEELGSSLDLAKGKRENKYNDIYMRMTGTIPEKRAKAESEVEHEKIMAEIYNRAYRQLKNKVENADRMYSALKKIISKRMVDRETFRKELG